MPLIELKHLTKTFRGKTQTVEALRDINLTINQGDIYGIIGMSGAGTSTLVRCINFLERPTSGSVIIDGKDLSTLSPKELRQLRQQVSMIFQHFNLLQQRDVRGNIAFAMEIAGKKKAEIDRRIDELLEIVGLTDRQHNYPSQLSGGQQQRVAIARELATNPKIILCDEATSALDPQTTQSILSLIRDIHSKLGITVIVITHQMSVVEQICTRVAILDQGEVAEEGKVSEVFASPRSRAAKRLVYPEGYEQTVVRFDGGRMLRVVFNGAKATLAPLIAQMAIERNIAASILSASTRSIGDKAYGNMLLGIPGGEEELRRAVEYLKEIPDIYAEEVESHVS